MYWECQYKNIKNEDWTEYDQKKCICWSDDGMKMVSVPKSLFFQKLVSLCEKEDGTDTSELKRIQREVEPVGSGSRSEDVVEFK